MSKAVAAVFGLLLLAASAFGQDIKGDLAPKEYGFAVLTVESPGSAVLWRVTPAPVQKEVRDNVLRFGGRPGTDYSVTATVIDWKAQKATEAEAVVRFGGTPGPPVPPLPPVDPLVVKLRTAFTATGFAKADNLAGGFAMCRALSLTASTWGDLFANSREALKGSMNGASLPPAIAAILASETLAAGLPTDPAAKVTADGAGRAIALYERLEIAVRAAGGAK